MKFFVDTADIAEIRDLADTGLLDGVTTNPSLVAKSGRKFLDLVAEICEVVNGPVSAEVASTDFETMLAEAHKIAKISHRVAVKVPLTPAGLKVCKIISSEGTMVNVTLCFSPAQAILAAKAGASFVSPFVGRLDDIGQDGMGIIQDICEIYRNYDHSIRNPMHIVKAARLGAHVVTAPPSVLKQLFNHPLTDKGLAQFVDDWKKTGQSIL